MTTSIHIDLLGTQTRFYDTGKYRTRCIEVEGESDLDALRETSVNALLNPTPELLRKRLEWLMPLGA